MRSFTDLLFIIVPKLDFSFITNYKLHNICISAQLDHILNLVVSIVGISQYQFSNAATTVCSPGKKIQHNEEKYKCTHTAYLETSEWSGGKTWAMPLCGGSGGRGSGSSGSVSGPRGSLSGAMRARLFSLSPDCCSCWCSSASGVATPPYILPAITLVLRKVFDHY